MLVPIWRRQSWWSWVEAVNNPDVRDHFTVRYDVGHRVFRPVVARPSDTEFPNWGCTIVHFRFGSALPGVGVLHPSVAALA